MTDDTRLPKATRESASATTCPTCWGVGRIPEVYFAEPSDGGTHAQPGPGEPCPECTIPEIVAKLGVRRAAEVAGCDVARSDVAASNARRGE